MAKLSSAVMDDITIVLNEYDKVGDKQVAITDILHAMRALGLNPETVAYKDILQDYKEKNVERISIEEFASIYQQEEAKDGNATHKELVEGIKALDPVNADSGLISRAVLLRFLTVLGDKLTEAEAEKIVVSSTLEKKGKMVNIDEIVRRVMTVEGVI